MGLFSGLLKGAMSLFGGTKGILGGVSSAIDYKAAKEQEQIRQKGELEQVKESGRQQRETSRYDMELAAAMDEYQRQRKRGAFKNFGFATPTDPYAQTAMQGYQQVWKPEDTKLVLPGAPGASGSSAITNAEPGSPYAPPVRPPNSLAAPVRR